MKKFLPFLVLTALIAACGVSLKYDDFSTYDKDDPVVQSKNQISNYRDSNKELVIEDSSKMTSEEKYNYETRTFIKNMIDEILPTSHYSHFVYTTPTKEREEKYLVAHGITRFAWRHLPLGRFLSTRDFELFYRDEVLNKFIGKTFSKPEMNRLLSLQWSLYSNEGLMPTKLMNAGFVRYIENTTRPKNNYRNALRILVNLHQRLFVKLLKAQGKEIPADISALAVLQDDVGLEEIMSQRSGLYWKYLDVPAIAIRSLALPSGWDKE